MILVPDMELPFHAGPYPNPCTWKLRGFGVWDPPPPASVKLRGMQGAAGRGCLHQRCPFPDVSVPVRMAMFLGALWGRSGLWLCGIVWDQGSPGARAV